MPIFYENQFSSRELRKHTLLLNIFITAGESRDILPTLSRLLKNILIYFKKKN